MKSRLCAWAKLMVVTWIDKIGFINLKPCVAFSHFFWSSEPVQRNGLGEQCKLSLCCGGIPQNKYPENTAHLIVKSWCRRTTCQTPTLEEPKRWFPTSPFQHTYFLKIQTSVHTSLCFPWSVSMDRSWAPNCKFNIWIQHIDLRNFCI